MNIMEEIETVSKFNPIMLFSNSTQGKKKKKLDWAFFFSLVLGFCIIWDEKRNISASIFLIFVI